MDMYLPVYNMLAYQTHIVNSVGETVLFIPVKTAQWHMRLKMFGFVITKFTRPQASGLCNSWSKCIKHFCQFRALTTLINIRVSARPTAQFDQYIFSNTFDRHVSISSCVCPFKIPCFTEYILYTTLHMLFIRAWSNSGTPCSSWGIGLVSVHSLTQQFERWGSEHFSAAQQTTVPGGFGLLGVYTAA